jgi:hypothetical protein
LLADNLAGRHAAWLWTRQGKRFMSTSECKVPEPPPYWVTKLDDVGAHLARLGKWQVREIGRSAGGRPLWACTCGPKKDVRRTANFSSAYHSGAPEAFWGADAKQQCLMIVVCVHGAETEGICGAVHFLHLVEHGHDLLGREWPEIVRPAQGMRLVVVPVANPDGRARVTVPSMIGMETDEFVYWAQGRWKTGQNIGYPACKRHQPLPLDQVEFLGGYPNDDGYNLQHDVTPGDIRTAEVRALLELAADETPDCVLNVHSHGMGPNLLGCTTVLPRYEEHQRALSASVEGAEQARGLRPVPYRYYGGYDLDSAFHFTCGALAVTFEGPHGVKSNPYTYQEILDCHLSAIEGTLAFGAKAGFRPPRGK